MMGGEISKKVIRSKADLAINGASPAFDKPLHVGRPNVNDRKAFIERANTILDRCWLTNDGPMVREFEARVAAYLGAKHCVAMCNGTIALEIAIRAAGFQGEVIVPSWTFVATAHALYWQDITPVFADIDPLTHNLDPAAVERLITPRTTGILGVHLWGRAAPVEQLQTIATNRGLKLIFDAAHGFGCTHAGRMIGNFGMCEVLSFHATKFFNTMEGGAIVTNDDDLAAKARLMRNFGFIGYDEVIHPGTNGKMTEICAAMGLTNLESIDSVVDINRRNYEAYKDVLSDVTGVDLIAYSDDEQNNFQYVVLDIQEDSSVSRDDIVAALHAENVLARKYFWPGCHRMEPYATLYPNAGRTLLMTERVAGRVIVLPTGRAVTERDIGVIGAIIAQLVNR